MRNQNDALVCRGRVTGDGHYVSTHLIDVDLAEAFVGQFAVKAIESTPGGNDSGFGVDAITPLLIFACFIDDMNLYRERKLSIIYEVPY